MPIRAAVSLLLALFYSCLILNKLSSSLQFYGEAGLQDSRKWEYLLFGLRTHLILMILRCTVLTFLWQMSSQPAAVQPSSAKACGAISEYPSMLHHDWMVCFVNMN
jgi:hypothetical protein